MDSKTIRGMALAASAAALFAAGCASPGGTAGSTATEAKVTCNGANACKGLSECHTAKNECAGQNACKGQGWVSLTPAECKQATGRS
jgi:hypothetical protein